MKTPDFTFEIKGITLDMCDMQRVHENYEIYCTAEYIMENYDLSEYQALKVAANVRHLMDKHGCTEEEAIYKILNK